MYIGVHLPQGARVWGLRAYARRGVNTDYDTNVNATLKEFCFLTNELRILGQRLTATFQPGSISKVKELFFTDLDHLIDNRTHCYFLEVSTTADGFSRSWFSGAVVIYR